MKEEDIIEGMTVSHESLGFGIILERYKWQWEMKFWWFRKWKRRRSKGVVEVIFLFSSPSVRVCTEDLEVVNVNHEVQKEIHEKAIGFTPTSYDTLLWWSPPAGYRRAALMPLKKVDHNNEKSHFHDLENSIASTLQILREFLDPALSNFCKAISDIHRRLNKIDQ